MDLHALHIHSPSSSSPPPLERNHNNTSCRDTKTTLAPRTPMRTLIKEDVSPIAIQLYIAGAGGWTKKRHNKGDWELEETAFTVQFICIAI